MNKVQTGLLNYFIDVEKVKSMLEMHPLKDEVLKFKPTSKTRKAFLTAYNKFLRYKENLDLTKFGFRAETLTSEAFGTKTFYKTDFKDFFYSEIFEAIHLKLV